MLYLSSAAVEVAERSPFSGTLGTILGTVIAAIITGAAMYLVAKVGRRTGKESGDWQRIEGLWGRVDKLEEEVVQLRAQNTTQATRMTQQATRMTDLETQNDEHERKISGLERWKDAALRYIASLIKAITDLGGTPPDPPPDYIDPR